jgi:hypothetical protein
MCVIITRNKLERYQYWQRELAERTAEAVAFWINEYPQIATTDSPLQLNQALPGFTRSIPSSAPTTHGPTIMNRSEIAFII